VHWTAPATAANTGLDNYRVFRTDPNGTTLLATLGGTTLSLVDSGLPEGATRTYEVRASNIVGEGAGLAATARTFARPTAPTNMTSASGPGVGELTIGWQVPTDIGGTPLTAYRILRGTTVSDLAPIGDVAATTTSFKDTGLGDGTTRMYAVVALNQVGTSVPSARSQSTTYVRPGTPQQVTAKPGSGIGQTKVTWVAPVHNGGTTITAYRIYRAKGSGAFALVGNVAGTVRTYTDSGLSAATVYRYRVSAVNQVGEGAPSAVGCSMAFPGTAPANCSQTNAPNQPASTGLLGGIFGPQL
jgi:predicted phage tail protein